jgi:uncharacterized membrane protein YdbT with pleckstrin-like domain
MIKLEDNEKVIKVFRKHWLPVSMELLSLLLVVVIPIFVFAFLRNNLLFDLSIRNAYFLFLLYTFFLIFIWILSAIIWLDYYLDMWLLTDKRLIDVEQKGLFSREISSLRLDRIQDITVETYGLVNTLLKIGNVHVQTASAQKEFLIRQVSKPDLVKSLINTAHNLEMEKVQVVKIEN